MPHRPTNHDELEAALNSTALSFVKVTLCSTLRSLGLSPRLIVDLLDTLELIRKRIARAEPWNHAVQQFVSGHTEELKLKYNDTYAVSTKFAYTDELRLDQYFLTLKKACIWDIGCGDASIIRRLMQSETIARNTSQYCGIDIFNHKPEWDDLLRLYKKRMLFRSGAALSTISALPTPFHICFIFSALQSMSDAEAEALLVRLKQHAASSETHVLILEDSFDSRPLPASDPNWDAYKFLPDWRGAANRSGERRARVEHSVPSSKTDLDEKLEFHKSEAYHSMVLMGFVSHALLQQRRSLPRHFSYRSISDYESWFEKLGFNLRTVFLGIPDTADTALPKCLFVLTPKRAC